MIKHDVSQSVWYAYCAGGQPLFSFLARPWLTRISPHHQPPSLFAPNHWRWAGSGGLIMWWIKKKKKKVLLMQIHDRANAAQLQHNFGHPGTKSAFIQITYHWTLLVQCTMYLLSQYVVYLTVFQICTRNLYALRLFNGTSIWLITRFSITLTSTTTFPITRCSSDWGGSIKCSVM